MNDAPAMPARRSLFHQAAKYSLYAPIAALLLGMTGNIVLDDLSETGFARLGGLAIGVFNIFLILSGFAAGIVALFGIGRHGAKGIVGPAVPGMLISGILILFMALATPALLRAVEKARHNQAGKPEPDASP